MANGLKRFLPDLSQAGFATLRFAQNDNYLNIMGEGGGSGNATSTSLTSQNDITRCHSERSEESLNFSRTVLFIFMKSLSFLPKN